MTKQFVIALRVSNQSGVLTRISAMFSRRGFNIDSITASHTETEGVSRITVTSTGDDYTRKQMIKQLSKLHEVYEIIEMDPQNSAIRELMIIKLKVTDETRQQIMDAVTVFRSNIIDYGAESICVSITGQSDKINAFIELMKNFGILEMCRTGVVALERGADCLRLKNMDYLNMA